MNKEEILTKIDTNKPLPNDELKHWGIKGMKWGHRRFQNKDGSLTPAGEKRYDDSEGSDSKTKYEVATTSSGSGGKYAVATVNKQKNAVVPSNKKSEKSKKKEAKNKKDNETTIDVDDVEIIEPSTSKNKKTKNNKETIIDAEYEEVKTESKNSKKGPDGPDGPDGPGGPGGPGGPKNPTKKDVDYYKLANIAKTTGKAASGAGDVNKAVAKIRNKKKQRQEMDAMDNKQLRERVERLELENRYTNATSGRMTKGHQYVQNFCDTAAPVAATLASGLTIAALIKDLKK